MEYKMEHSLKWYRTLLLVTTLALSGCGSEDEDTDGDGISDSRDNCIQINNPDQLNTDGDALGDDCDPDDDNDGVNDAEDAFPLDSSEQADVDNDGLGDKTDLDLNRPQRNSADIVRLTEQGRVTRIIAPQYRHIARDIGQNVAYPGDVNGDGFDDLLIGYGSYSVNDLQMGIGYLIFGRERGFPQDIFLAELDQTDLDYVVFQTDEGETDSLGLGASVSGLGDINGDNLDDFSIVAIAADTDLGNISGGEVYIVFGRQSWPDKAVTVSELKSTYAMGYKGQAPQEFGLLGRQVVNVGDVNNDTLADIMISEHGYTLDIQNEGRVHLILGGDHFAPPVNNQPSMINIDELPDSIHTVINGFGAYSWTGHQLSALGDFNNDQIPDIAISAHHYNRSDWYEDDGTGAVHIVFGREDWPVDMNLANLDGKDGLTIYGNGLGLQFGKSIAAADFNKDQIGDLVIGAPEHAVHKDVNPNKVYMLRGGAGPWPASMTSSQIESTYGSIITSDVDVGLGISMAPLQDTDGDGYPELLISTELCTDDFGGDYFDSGQLFKLSSKIGWNNLELTYTDLPIGVDRIGAGSARACEVYTVRQLGDYNQDGVPEMLMDTDHSYRDSGVFDTFFIVNGFKDLITDNVAE
jgi:hypothetical protein